jgi:dienelactone hydrolase
MKDAKKMSLKIPLSRNNRRGMMIFFASIILMNIFLLNNNITLAQNSSSHQKNGTVVEKIYGFPYKTYEQWHNTCKSRYTFDEEEFKRKFPPEDFNKYKNEINCPFETYEEWLQVLKKRFSHSQFNEILFRKNYPPEDFERFKEEIEFIKIRYMSDRLKVAGFILRPKSLDDKKLPTIIYNRGGNQDIELIDFEKLYSFFNLVLQGYILVASQYRGCGSSEGHDEIGGSDVNDVINLIPLIESLPYADATRIGMYGWSRGGVMTYIALTKTDRISAAVIGAGPTDFLNAIIKRPNTEKLFSKLVPDYWKNKEVALKSRSALYWPEKLNKRTPILLLQGGSDWRTDPMDVLKMAELLYETKHPFRFVFFEGGDHGLNQYKKEVYDMIIHWFKRYLRDNNLWPNSKPIVN